jgi:hypothetical protein
MKIEWNNLPVGNIYLGRRLTVEEQVANQLGDTEYLARAKVSLSKEEGC